jgi:hypothetical protein
MSVCVRVCLVGISSSWVQPNCQHLRTLARSGCSTLISLASSQHNLNDIYLLLCVQCQTPDDGQSTCPKHVEFYSKNKSEKLVHLVDFIIGIYYDARSSKCQILLTNIPTYLSTYLFTAIELSLGGSSPYTSTHKTNKNKYTQTKQYKTQSTNNTKHGKYKYTYYQNTHTLQNPHIHKLTHYKTK